jgi:2-C-methyl-D-erythritol 4-phosphate cytidylyltransferase
VKLIDDESEFVKKPFEVHMVEAGNKNIKIRNLDDFALATALFNVKLNR